MSACVCQVNQTEQWTGEVRRCRPCMDDRRGWCCMASSAYQRRQLSWRRFLHNSYVITVPSVDRQRCLSTGRHWPTTY